MWNGNLLPGKPEPEGRGRRTDQSWRLGRNNTCHWGWCKWCLNDKGGPHWGRSLRERRLEGSAVRRLRPGGVPLSQASSASPRAIILLAQQRDGLVLLLQECTSHGASCILRLPQWFFWPDCFRRLVPLHVQCFIYDVSSDLSGNSRHRHRRSRWGPGEFHLLALHPQTLLRGTATHHTQQRKLSLARTCRNGTFKPNLLHLHQRVWREKHSFCPRKQLRLLDPLASDIHLVSLCRQHAHYYLYARRQPSDEPRLRLHCDRLFRLCGSQQLPTKQQHGKNSGDRLLFAAFL